MTDPNEISITVTCDENQRTDTLMVSPSSMTLSELCYLTMAVLAIDSNEDYCLVKVEPNSKTLLHSSVESSKCSLSQAGIRNGDWILLQARKRFDSEARAKRTKQDLDFSSLLSQKNQSSGLFFNVPSVPPTAPPNYVHWDGMTLDQALEYNSHPENFIRVLFHNIADPCQPQRNHLPSEETTLFREFHHYYPILAKKIKELILSPKSPPAWKEASKLWTEQVQKQSMTHALNQSLNLATHQEMTRRLQFNPMDEEAKAYFDQRSQQQIIQHQYEQMMEEYPESMCPVVMLYIEVVVDGSHPIQAMVDSGAQMTIMSKSCAQRCNLLSLVDTRFAGVAVGVGRGKILGRVHLVQLKINNMHFPCSITVMDDDGSSGSNHGGGSGGLGDKNVDLLFGLDMLKRHRCKIDLETNSLIFSIHDDKTMTTPFLQERELETRRGGTKDLNVEKMNAETEDENMHEPTLRP